METLYEIGCLCGRFILSSAFLMLVYLLLLKKSAPFVFSRIYLLAVPFLSLIMTFLSIEIGEKAPTVVYVDAASSLPASSDAAVKTAMPDNVGHTLSDVAENLPSMSLSDVLTAVYILVSALLFIHLAYGVCSILLLRHKSRKYRFGRLNLYRSAYTDSPFSFMTSVYLPEVMTGNAERLVIKHELAHIRCRHYIDIIIIETTVRLLWFNPVLWAVLVELRNVHEFQADSKVLATGENIHSYQTLLLEEVLSSRFGFANGFNHSFIRRRFLSMKDFASRRLDFFRTGLAGVSVLLLVAVFCFTESEAEVVYKLRGSLAVPTLDIPAVHIPSGEINKLDVIDSESVADVTASADDAAAEAADMVRAEEIPADSQSLDAVVSKPVSVDSVIAGQVSRKSKNAEFVPLKVKSYNDGIPVVTYARGAIPSPGYASIIEEFSDMKVPFYIMRDKKETRLMLLSYVNSDEQTYFFSSNLFIVDCKTGDRYKVRRVLNYNLDERFRLLNYKRNVVEFTLVFPPLPESVRIIDVVESGTTRRWNFRNVRIKDVEREAVKVVL